MYSILGKVFMVGVNEIEVEEKIVSACRCTDPYVPQLDRRKDVLVEEEASFPSHRRTGDGFRYLSSFFASGRDS